MNKAKILIRLFFLITILFVNAEASTELEDDSSGLIRSTDHPHLMPKILPEIWYEIFEIGSNDKIFLKKFRSVCVEFRNKEAKFSGERRAFYFRLDKDSLPEFKTSSLSNAIIEAETLWLDPLFMEKNSESCKRITSLEVLAPDFESWPYFNCITLVSLRNLKKLDLQRRIFFPADFYPITYSINLEELNLAGSNFIKEAFSFISKLTNLKNLNVYSCCLSNKQGQSLFKLTQLKKLDMDGNFLETDDLSRFDNFTKFTKLEVLSLVVPEV